MTDLVQLNGKLREPTPPIDGTTFDVAFNEEGLLEITREGQVVRTFAVTFNGVDVQGKQRAAIMEIASRLLLCDNEAKEFLTDSDPDSTKTTFQLFKEKPEDPMIRQIYDTALLPITHCIPPKSSASSEAFKEHFGAIHNAYDELAGWENKGLTFEALESILPLPQTDKRPLNPYAAFENEDADENNEISEADAGIDDNNKSSFPWPFRWRKPENTPSVLEFIQDVESLPDEQQPKVAETPIEIVMPTEEKKTNPILAYLNKWFSSKKNESSYTIFDGKPIYEDEFDQFVNE